MNIDVLRQLRAEATPGEWKTNYAEHPQMTQCHAQKQVYYVTRVSHDVLAFLPEVVECYRPKDHEDYHEGWTQEGRLAFQRTD